MEIWQSVLAQLGATGLLIWFMRERLKRSDKQVDDKDCELKEARDCISKLAAESVRAASETKAAIDILNARIR